MILGIPSRANSCASACLLSSLPSQYAHIWNAGVVKAYFLTVTFICVIQLLCFQDLHFHVVYTILFTFTSSIVLACSSIVHYVCMYSICVCLVAPLSLTHLYGNVKRVLESTVITLRCTQRSRYG